MCPITALRQTSRLLSRIPMPTQVKTRPFCTGKRRAIWSYEQPGNTSRLVEQDEPFQPSSCRLQSRQSGGVDASWPGSAARRLHYYRRVRLFSEKIRDLL